MKYTRKIQREYNAILFKNSETKRIDVDGEKKADFNINMSDLDKANDYLVMAMLEVSQKELDNMEPKEYEKKLKECRIFAGLDEEEEKGKN